MAGLPVKTKKVGPRDGLQNEKGGEARVHRANARQPGAQPSGEARREAVVQREAEVQQLREAAQNRHDDRNRRRREEEAARKRREEEEVAWRVWTMLEEERAEEEAMIPTLEEFEAEEEMRWDMKVEGMKEELEREGGFK